MKTFNQFKQIIEMAATPEEMTGIRKAVEEVLTTFVMRQRGVQNLSRVDYEKSFHISHESAGGKYIVYDLLDGEGQPAKLPGGGKICFVNNCQRIAYFFREFTTNSYIKNHFVLKAKNAIRQGKIYNPQLNDLDDSYVHYLITKDVRVTPYETNKRKAGSIQLKNISKGAQVVLDFKNLSEFEIVRSDKF